MLSLEQLRALPKVALHDHLDGGLRPATVIEHCAENGHELPTTDPAELGEWFVAAADSGSLERYLTTFDHTIAAMQTAAQLRRVAAEFVLDQANDGVIYAEARYAPEQHLAGGLSLSEVVQAVGEGLDEGMSLAQSGGKGIVARQIVTAMRHVAPRWDVCESSLAGRDHGVCGFDLAGAEAGFPPGRFVEIFDELRANYFNLTIHAGEAAGPASIAEAVTRCNADRIGHGVRISEDITRTESGYQLGAVASYVRDHRIALEVCPSSNLQTGIAETIADHPVGLLDSLGFNVSINCDNRLMSGTTLSREFWLTSQAFGWGIADVERMTIQAMAAAFLPYDQREALIQGIIRPAFALAKSDGAE